MGGGMVIPLAVYRCWTLDTPHDAARAAFVARYCYEPEQVFTWMRMIWVGPVKEIVNE